jgi:hypothetical protein
VFAENGLIDPSTGLLTKSRSLVTSQKVWGNLSMESYLNTYWEEDAEMLQLLLEVSKTGASNSLESALCWLFTSPGWVPKSS